jgi:hypothetical protein
MLRHLVITNCDYKTLFLSLVSVLVLSVTPSLAHEVGQLRKVEDAFNTKRYAEAETMLKRLADSNPRAAWILGDLYMGGRGVPPNPIKARELWEHATAAGDQDAMCSLASLLNDGGATDRKRALALYEKSASLGCVHAQFNMGLECMWGRVTRQDYSRALTYFQSGAKTGDGNAECLLAHLYESGLGASKDLHRAASLMKLATVHGCALGEYQIGRTYLQGLGMPKDYDKAYYWLSKGAADGNPHAMNDLGNMYADGRGVKVDDKKGLEWSIKAEKNGCPMAKYNLAERYRTGHGLPKDLKKARARYEELAKVGDKKSAEKLKLISSD